MPFEMISEFRAKEGARHPNGLPSGFATAELAIMRGPEGIGTSRGKIPIMNSLLLHCRPGFEGEVCAEIGEHAALLGVAGYAKARPNSAHAEFVCGEPGGAERLMGGLRFAELVFPRQWARGNFVELPESERIGVLLARLADEHLEVGLGEGFAHEGEGFRTAEVVVAGVGGAAFPERGFGGRDEVSLELLHKLPLLLLRHPSIRVGMVLVL